MYRRRYELLNVGLEIMTKTSKKQKSYYFAFDNEE